MYIKIQNLAKIKHKYTKTTQNQSNLPPPNIQSKSATPTTTPHVHEVSTPPKYPNPSQ